MAAVAVPDPYFLSPANNIREEDSATMKAMKQRRKARRIADAEAKRAKEVVRQSKQSKEIFELQKDAQSLRTAELEFAISQFVKDGVREGSIPESHLRKVFEGENATVLQDLKSLGQTAFDINAKDEEFLQKVSTTTGGIPLDLANALEAMRIEPVTLHEAAKLGNVTSIKRFVTEKNFPVDYEDKLGISPLGYAVAAGQLEAAQALRDLGASAFSVDANGNSALHFAAAYGQQAIAEYLLDNGTSINKRNSKGETAVAVAQAGGHDAVVAMLKGRGG
eukprot:CAMPEP_0178459260 /NCGR_PEP_ID=MMETSP0689_2-20121128/48026_1 /TAXON_ID=160604 /ORGANISM="Amphidinium massartii, Strain CS-259" /LENGTH=277 /DNA_ID=CAMNT_0020085707 /DNA_START=13 /DNA_END=842 /DNA_ORIENTATION=-